MTTTVVSGLTVKNKDEAYRSTTNKAIDMRDNGKLTYPMDRERSFMMMGRLMSASLGITRNMGRGSFLMLRMLRFFSSFMIMA